MQKKVTTIPATLGRFDSKPIITSAKKKVAAYARVSTDTEEQATSYEAQVDYYTKYIKDRADWDFAGMYTDEGITATNTKNRDGFKKMVEDALAGKIDLIITKSVSRFARNTVDSLTTVRELKEKGVEIYFEKENIWTLDSKGELLITIMSSLAQEESRSISENTTWGRRKQFADGKATVSFSRFLGYDKGPNGEFVINEEQAKIVRYIYQKYLEGYSAYVIANQLTKMGVPTPGGKTVWQKTTVLSILRNEKYKGDALLQKYFTKDFLAHKRVTNQGEVPQYYVEGHHEGIVTPEQYEQVQAEMKRREKLRKEGMGNYSGRSIFGSKIVCGQCGKFYGAKIWHKGTHNEKRGYECNHKYKGDFVCRTPVVTEAEIKEYSIKAINKMLSGRKEIIENAYEIIEIVGNTDELDRQADECLAELNIITQQMQEAISENSSKALNQKEYEKRYMALKCKYDAIKDKYYSTLGEVREKKARLVILQEFIHTLESTKQVLTEFDEGLWSNLIERITVINKENIVVTFKNGQEITVS